MAEDSTQQLLRAPSSDGNITLNEKEQNEKEQQPSKLHLILAVLACIYGSPVQIGLNVALLNTPEDVIKDFYNETYFDRREECMPSDLLTILWAVTVAFFCVGGMLGGFAAGYLPHRFGRKNTLLWNNILAIVTAGLQAGSKYAASYEMLILGRVVAGICCGINSAVAPLYLAEISPVMLRGFCGTCNQLAITSGVLLGEAVGSKYLLGTPELWPIAVACPIVPAIYSFLTLTSCPESPRFLLVVKDDADGARKALKWLRNTDDVEEEMELMERERAELRNSQKFSVTDLFKSPSLRWPLIICVVLQMSQQFSGINAVIYYSTSIFESAGLSESVSQFATLGAGLVNITMTFISALLMDKAGRRTLHMTGLGGMCVFSGVLVVSLVYQSKASWLPYISIISIVIYIIFFATGPGSIPWFIVAEMFAQGPRTAAVSVSVIVNWLCNFVVGLVYPILQKSIDSYSFLPFTVMLAVFFVFTYLFVPETKGKTISEITMMFEAPDERQSNPDFNTSDVPYESLVNQYDENGMRTTANDDDGRVRFH